MRKISTVLDFMIYDFFTFLVLLIFFSSFTNGVFPFVLSALGTIAFSALFLKIRGRVFLRKKRESDTKKRQKLIETSLLYQTNSECLGFFKSFFSSVQGLVLSELDCFLQGEETVVFPCFSSPEIGFEELLRVSKIAREQGAKHLIVPCIKTSVGTSFLLGMFETISVFESRALFDKMIEFDFFPTMIDEKVLPKKSFKTLFSACLTRAKARGFGGIGLSLFVFAFFSPYKTYYLIVSACLLLCCCILLLKKR
ncbi:MAG: hypothetical protein R3Y32_07555 [Bacillota bacterium]